jgi:hypothetical protein
LINDLGDRGLFRLYESRAGGYFDILGYRADVESQIDLRVVADLQHDSALYVGFEALHGSLKTVGPNRQVRQSVSAILI